MQLGLVGLRSSGKSALFAALTGLDPAAGGKRRAQAAVPVPDERLDRLAAIIQPKKTTPAHVEYVDLPGVEPGDEHSRASLGELRQTAGLLLVLRGFAAPGLPAPDAADERRRLDEELVFSDLAAAEGRITRLERSSRHASPQQDQEKRELEALKRCRQELEEGRGVAGAKLRPDEEKQLRGFGFLTAKPRLIVFNAGEDAAGAPPPAGLGREGENEPALALCARLEKEIAELDEADRAEFLAALDLKESARARLIRASYEALGLITFYTVKGPEVRAWPLPAGATALEAAGAVHTDMAKGFIRAEVMSFADLTAQGSVKAARQANLHRVEGKGYAVQDGDILEIRFSPK